MNKYLTYPLALATLFAITVPAVNFAAYAQQSDTQQAEAQPKPESETATPSE
ncbi:MAG: hypothetical protein O3C34_13240 [Proteobacteria bacterium]|nr:hypothetical protein [Pseudomonadota bacterium]